MTLRFWRMMMSDINEVLNELIASQSYKNADGSYNRLRGSSDATPDVVAESDLKEPENIDELLCLAAEQGASDIHIVVGAPPKFRVNGELTPVRQYATLTADVVKRILEPTIQDADISTQFDKDGDLDFAYQIKGVARFRVNLYKQRGTWAGVFRMLSNKVPSVRDLKLPQAIVNLTTKKRGLILVTGPTGSGKSTTLASLIAEINEHYRKNVITLEDPIEYLHKHKMSNVSQREIGVDTKSFASALRASLREDPDVILVGEMRDFETISTAITAAETGHLVFSTLHTIGAAATIDRIIDTYPVKQQGQARSQLSAVIEGVISQQLIPRADGSGRIAAFEIMTGTTAIRNLIREGKTEQMASSIQTSRKDGMILLDDNLQELVRQGIITPEKAIEFAVDKKTMTSRLRV